MCVCVCAVGATPVGYLACVVSGGETVLASETNETTWALDISVGNMGRNALPEVGATAMSTPIEETHVSIYLGSEINALKTTSWDR